MAKEINPFLMFASGAEAAMNFYLSLFPGSKIETLTRYDAEDPGAAGSVKQATLMLLGRRLEFFDSPVQHAFTFTPAISFAVACESAGEVDHLFAQLSDGGQILMGLDAYPFARRFGWVNDRFGVSWQLRLI
ncbi:MAG TPA: VOC family protein [Rhizomicrobium sp.]|jgi:predicted 3-demethylubiquinone-9 3-methyltransferase (glyoxalase superfamily)